MRLLELCLSLRPRYQSTFATGCYDALRLIDLATLPSGEGTSAFLAELRGHDVYSMVNCNDTIIYANLRLGGFGVVRIDTEAKTIDWLATIQEPGVFYEDMAVVGHRLFVTAHGYGLRVFDVARPEIPPLVGSLTEGLTDAFAIAASDRYAYVADGAGGLKIIDVTNPAAMHIVAAEKVGDSAIGTAEDALVIGEDVYVAAGSEGVLVYKNGNIHDRHQFQTPGIARALAQVGPFLAVADISGVRLMQINPHAMLTPVASEAGLRRLLPNGDVTLRLWHGVAAWGTDRVVAANWDSIDVYKITPLALATQPDATLSDQRVRFSIAGGTKEVTLKNSGVAPLEIASLTSSAPANFKVSPIGPVTVAPGASLPLTLTCVPGPVSQAIITITSNDPDEAKLPIEVYGNTAFLDPGQPATPFTLPQWTYNHETKEFAVDTFSLTAHAGKVIYFQVFGTWCPACMPVIADMKNSLAAKFEHHPHVLIRLMSQKESAAVLEKYWDNIYLRTPMLFDLSGATSFVAYAQPVSGLPFSRGFLIGPDQVVRATWFSYNADRVVDAILHQLNRIAIPGDANLDGYVNKTDLEAIMDAWGAWDDPDFCPADLNGDGVVNGLDLAFVLRFFGTSAE